MVQVGLKYNFNFISSHIPPALSNPTEKIHMELNASDSELSMQFSHVACQFLVNNLHFINISHTHRAKSRWATTNQGALVNRERNF